MNPIVKSIEDSMNPDNTISVVTPYRKKNANVINDATIDKQYLIFLVGLIKINTPKSAEVISNILPSIIGSITKPSRSPINLKSTFIFLCVRNV